MTMAKKMVLVVENDEELREAVGSALAHAGFDALGARSARQALSFLDEVAPDLIVLDFLLHEMDGVELTKAIRARAGLGLTPLLMVTGAPEVASAQLSKAGMDIPVLAKPLDADVLTRMAERLCAAGAA
jgi:DNA-binding response OmpR family regulator